MRLLQTGNSTDGDGEYHHQDPVFDADRPGVPQPRLATNDVLILVFMFMLWGYSLYLTYRAWYKLLYSGGEDSGTNMWRYILDMVTLKKRNETRRKTLIDTELHKDINTSPIL